jgi:transposase
MWLPSASLRIFVARDPADMRRAYDGLSGIVRDILREDPFSGALFVFFNRARDRVKVLYWDRGGFCLWGKRLEAGRFARPASPGALIPFDIAELTLLLEGIDLDGSKRRKRYGRIPAATAAE